MSGRALPPRVVVVARRSERDELLLRHGTLQQARFFVESRGQKLEDALERHRVLEAALRAVVRAVPTQWRRARILRHELDRFLFDPDDVVVAVGQDGLVANVAKYLHGQPVIGVNPSKALFPGVLVRHPPEAAGDLLAGFARGVLACEERTMVRARLSDGQELVALNEIYVGHTTHQSARYHLDVRRERRAPFLVGVDRGHRHRIERLGQEHLAEPQGAARAARAARRRAGVPRARGLGQRHHRRRAHRRADSHAASGCW